MVQFLIWNTNCDVLQRNKQSRIELYNRIFYFSKIKTTENTIHTDDIVWGVALRIHNNKRNETVINRHKKSIKIKQFPSFYISANGQLIILLCCILQIQLLAIRKLLKLIFDY